MPNVFRKGNTRPLLPGPLTVQLAAQRLDTLPPLRPQPSSVHLAVIQVATQRLTPTMENSFVKVAHDLHATQPNGQLSALILLDLSSIWLR